MNRTTRFDDILDECLERLLVRNETVEQCLQSFPQHASELKPLLEVALAARQASAIEPRPEFKGQARQQLNLRLRELEAKKSRGSFNWTWGWQPRWATAVAVVLVFFLAGGTTVAAAAGSMPDNPLYAVKRATEEAQLALTFSELGKAELHTRLADKRVTEIAYLAERGRSDKIAEVTERLSAHLSKVSFLVAAPGVMSLQAVAPMAETAAVPEEPPAPAPAILPEQAERLRPEPAPKGAAVLQKEEKTSKDAKPQEDQKEREEKRSKDDRRANLKSTVENQAKENIARLRALLETAPEAAKPALRRALEKSEAEYGKALESLE